MTHESLKKWPFLKEQTQLLAMKHLLTITLSLFFFQLLKCTKDIFCGL